MVKVYIRYKQKYNFDYQSKTDNDSHVFRYKQYFH